MASDATAAAAAAVAATATAPDAPDAAVLVSISGPSSSGKTTISRLLRDLFPTLFILHQDDFYKAESELPIKDGFADWDCAESLDLAGMDAALAHIRTHGEIPPWLKSKEDQNAVGPVPISDACIQAQRLRVQDWHHAHHLTSTSKNSTTTSTTPTHQQLPTSFPKICLVDGFLLYTPPLALVTRHLHARLLLLASRPRVLARRAARAGYVTLEGFWADPPGYVERVVWPNYAHAHGWLFERGDVESGRLDRGVLAQAGIEAVERGQQEEQDQGDADVDLETVLEWAVGRVMRAVDDFVASSKGAEA